MSNTCTSNTISGRVWVLTWLVLTFTLLVTMLADYNQEILPFIFLITVIALFGSLPALVILLTSIDSFVQKKCMGLQKLLRLLSLQLLCCCLYGSVTYIVTIDSGLRGFAAAGVTIAVITGCNCFSVLWNMNAVNSYVNGGARIPKAAL